MVYVNMFRVNTGGLKYLWTAIGYPSKENPDEDRDFKLTGLGGYGVNYTDPEAAFDQMSKVDIYFGRTVARPLEHISISLDESVKTNKDACVIADKIACIYKNEHQLIWSVREYKNSQYQINIIINSVRVHDGKLFRSGFNEMYRLYPHVKKLTNQSVRMQYKSI